MSPPTILLTVPVPPSANRMFQRRLTKRGKRTLTPEYKAWRDEAGWIARMQLAGVPMIGCRFDVEIQVPISSRDTDNWIKPLLDLCQNIGAVTNDGNQRRVTVTPAARRDCMIALTELPDEPDVRKPVKPRFYRSTPRKPAAAQVRRATELFVRHLPR